MIRTNSVARIGILAFLILALLYNVGCSKDQGGWATFSKSGVGIKFRYPSKWVIGDPNKLDIQPVPDAYIYDPEKNNDDNFMTNLNLLVQHSPLLAPSAEGQAQETAQTLSLPGTGIENYKKLRYEPIQYGNTNAGLLTSEFTLSQNNKQLKNIEVFIPVGQKTYILTFTTSPDSWDNYKPLFDETIKSIEITNS